MFKEIETDFGRIEFDKNIISSIVEDVFEGYEGRIWLGNGSSRFQRMSGDSGNIDIELEEDVLTIDIYAILNFGTSIKAVTGEIFHSIDEKIDEALGVTEKRLKIIITGVQSRQQIARRNLEVVFDGI